MKIVKLQNKTHFFHFGEVHNLDFYDRLTPHVLERSSAYRLVNIIVAFCLGVIALPLFLMGYILVKLAGKGPVVYAQRRMGQGGDVFSVLKFRTMVTGAEAKGAVWASKNDPRVTKYGRFLRKTIIDELPQLWNVLRGDMNLVGPRPERPVFHGKILEKVINFDERLKVRPGITGLAQIECGYAASVDDSVDKFKLDQKYIQNKSYAYDLWILLRTIKVVLTGFGAR